MSTIESNKKDFSVKGTISNPYTEEEYQQLLAEGKDVACYVEGRGFCAPAAMAPPTNPGSPSDPSDPSDPFGYGIKVAAGSYTYAISTPEGVRINASVSWTEGFLPRSLRTDGNSEVSVGTPINYVYFPCGRMKELDAALESVSVSATWVYENDTLIRYSVSQVFIIDKNDDEGKNTIERETITYNENHKPANVEIISDETPRPNDDTNQQNP